MVPNCMLEDDNLHGLLHLIVGKPRAVDLGHYLGVDGVDAFIRVLTHIQESSSQKCQKCSSDLIVVAVVLNTCQGSSEYLGLLCHFQSASGVSTSLYPQTPFLAVSSLPLWDLSPFPLCQYGGPPESQWPWCRTLYIPLTAEAWIN